VPSVGGDPELCLHVLAQPAFRVGFGRHRADDRGAPADDRVLADGHDEIVA